MTQTRIRLIAGLCIIGAASSSLRSTSQEPAASPPIAKTFDVASVRANRSGTTQTRFDRMPTGVNIINLPLRAIIQFAYGVSQPSRLANVPDWVSIERFDITARGTINGLDDFRTMMQALLADRFKLATHTEQRDLPIHNLVLARSDRRLGPSLKPSRLNCPQAGRGFPRAGTSDTGESRGRGAGQPAAATDAPASEGCGLRPGGPGEFNFAGIPLELFASMLALTQQRPVIDKTGLTGTYDLHVLFAPDPIPGRAPDPATDGRPTLVTALQEQLGLKLDAGKQLQDVLVIDHVSRPDEN